MHLLVCGMITLQNNPPESFSGDNHALEAVHDSLKDNRIDFALVQAFRIAKLHVCIEECLQAEESMERLREGFRGEIEQRDQEEYRMIYAIDCRKSRF